MQRSKGGLRLFPTVLPQQRHPEGLPRHSPVLFTSGLPWFITRVGGKAKSNKKRQTQLSLLDQTPLKNAVCVAGATAGPEAANTSTSDARREEAEGHVATETDIR